MPKRKQPAPTSSSSEDQYTRSSEDFYSEKFISASAQALYLSIKDKPIIAERIIKLKDHDFPEFTNEINRRKWDKVARPPGHYHSETVKQFYSNATDTEEAKEARYTWVNKVKVYYDKQTINEVLGKPWKSSKKLCKYQTMDKAKSHNEDDVRQKLCITGFPTHQLSGSLLRISMHQLAMVWNTFILANIHPSSHVSDLPMAKCCLMWNILKKDTVDVSAIMSNAIAECIEKGITSMVLPSLITSLCRQFGAYHSDNTDNEVSLTKAITSTYVNNYCKPRDLDSVLSEMRRKNDIPKEPTPPPPTSHMDMLQQMQTQLTTVIQEQGYQNRQQIACYKAVTGLYQSFESIYGSHSNFVGLPFTDYLRNNQWPEGRPNGREGEGCSRQRNDDEED